MVEKKARIAVGTKVEWSSQANGNFKKKVGIVMGFLPASEPFSKYMERQRLPYWPVMAQDTSLIDRYIVLVESVGNKKKTAYYLPSTNALEIANPSAVTETLEIAVLRDAALEACIRINRDNPRAVVEVLEETFNVLKELVMLKEIKDTIGKTPDYLALQPLAWQRAREVLRKAGLREVSSCYR